MTLGTVLAVVGMLGAGRGAEAPIERRIEQIVERLASQSWEEREAASEELMALPMPEAQGPIIRRLELGGLTPEQRHRLVDAASRRLVEQPRGALGISMDMFGNPFGGVRVSAVIPGMPASEVLRPGDVIETINGQPITSSAVLSDLIQRLAPGTPVRLRIHRPVLDDQGRPRRDRAGQPVSKPLEVTMKLGSMEQLEAIEEQLGRVERMGRGGGRGMRRNVDVGQERDAEARWLRREYASEATFVSMVPEPGASVADSFSARLEALELAVQRIEHGNIRGSDGEELLRGALDGLEALRLRLGEPGVTDVEKQNFSRVLRRLTLVLSRDGLSLPAPGQP